MRALVVFESMFGNTRTIAEAVGRGLTGFGEVEISEVGSAPPFVAGEIGLLVVGGPTHAFGMSRANTREDAAKRAEHPVISEKVGIREWLEALPPAAAGQAAASFDTRIHKPRVPGSAARGAAKRLRGLGFRTGESVSFWVEGTEGPLTEGEIARAERWGAKLGAEMAPVSTG